MFNKLWILRQKNHPTEAVVPFLLEFYKVTFDKFYASF